MRNWTYDPTLTFRIELRRIKTIATFTSDWIDNSDVSSSNVNKLLLSTPIPSWELLSAQFDTDYSTIRKYENPHLLTNIARSHIADNYPNHLKVCTDGSVLENGYAGAGFGIPHFKTENAFRFGNCVLF